MSRYDPGGSPRRRSSLRALAVAAIFLMGSAMAPGLPPHPVVSRAEATVTADLVVYGATPSGIAAAIAANRAGLSVDLIEPSDRIGGMMTSGLGHSDVGDKGTIGGLALEFFRAVGTLYGLQRFGQYEAWNFEPSVAMRAFELMLGATSVRIHYGQRLLRSGGVQVEDGRITRIAMESGLTFAAHEFIDSSYEGDLMAEAGVPFTWGREASSWYDESLAGVQPATQVWPPTYGRWFTGRQAVIPGVQPAPTQPVGGADRSVQPYTFRLCVTTDPANRVPFPKPDGYQRKRYTALERYLAQVPRWGGTLGLDLILSISDLPDGKADLNAYGPFSTDDIGASVGYPDGSYDQRAQIRQTHYGYEAGLLYFLSTDDAVAAQVRAPLSDYGLCADEFTETSNWPPQLYVREARRMVSDEVLTQADLTPEAAKPDAIGQGSYRLDAHAVQLFVRSDGYLATEGSFNQSIPGPYDIPYGILVPPRGSIGNLLDSVTVSASHVAYASLRMEPHYMIMGQAAGVAAALAVASGSSVQGVNVADLQGRLIAAGVDLRPAATSHPLPLWPLGFLVAVVAFGLAVVVRRPNLMRLWRRLRARRRVQG